MHLNGMGFKFGIMYSSTPVFEERQQFRQWWIWLIILMSALPLPTILLVQIIGGQPVGDKPVSTLALIILTLIISVPLIGVFFIARMETRIDLEGIHYGWNIFGISMNHLKWTDISDYSVVEYPFLGYGYRISGKYGTVYNVNGNKGLLVQKKDGSKIMIGTAKPKEMEQALQQLRLSA